MNIEQLIQLNVELEGLLRVLANRDNEDTKKLLQTKYNEFKTAFDAALCNNESENLKVEQVAEPIVETSVEEQKVETIVEPELEEHEVPEVKPEPVQTKTSTPVATPILEPEFATVDEIVASRQNEMRVDEMLTRREAKDIRKAFTLNDKFRFRRELFANNDAQFADTLNVLSAMQSLDEAIEYMQDDLGWDMESDDVKDFVNIVSNHFSAV